MATTQPRGLILAGYLLTGSIAGLASCIFPRLFFFAPDLNQYLLGAVFGLLLVLFLRIFQGRRSFFHSFAFVVSSAVAYMAAWHAASFADGRWLPIYLPLLDVSPTDAVLMIAGGSAGAFVLFPAFYFLFAQWKSWDEFLTKLLLAVTTSVILGVLGWALWASVGTSAWRLLWTFHLGNPSEATVHSAPKDTAQFFSLYIVWQAGFALLLGVLCPLRPQVSSLDSLET
jgi:hypothetical protein